jgi:hypothetical protein
LISVFFHEVNLPGQSKRVKSNGFAMESNSESGQGLAPIFDFFAFGQDYDTARAQLVDASANNILRTIMTDRSVPYVGVRAS